MNTKKQRDPYAEFDQWVDRLVKDHVQTAKTGEWHGEIESEYFDACRRFNGGFGVASILTRDVGYQKAGMWQNPDFDRCLHLTLAFFQPGTVNPTAQHHSVATAIIKKMFFPHVKWVWIEPPYSERDRSHDVWHYRLFCDERWQAMRPPSDDAAKELTAKGWKSFADVQAAIGQFRTRQNAS